MKVLLLAAGLGTRLRPITDTIPKCLVPIGGKPLLEIWLDRLSAAGIGPFLVNTHYLGEQVEEFVERSSCKSMITLSKEENLLGTAGTLIANLEFFDDSDAMLIHADNYCLANLASFRAAHATRPPQCLATMMTFRTDNPTACGVVELDDQGVVIGFHEKVTHPPSDLANAAIYILSQQFIKELRALNKIKSCRDISRDVLPRFIGRIFTYETKEDFADIGTLEMYNKYKDKDDHAC